MKAPKGSPSERRRGGRSGATKTTGLTRLIVSELRHGYRPWLSVFAVSTVAAACTQLAMSLVVIGQSSTDPTISEASGTTIAEGYGTTAGAILTITLPAAVIAIAITASLCVRLSSKNVARWQLAGVIPRQAGRVVRAQLVIVCVVGAVAGAALTYAVWPWFGDLAVAALLPDSPALHAAAPFAAALWTVAIQIAVALVAGSAAARRTRRVEAIEVLRAVEGDERKGGPLRIVIAAALVAGVCAGGVALARQGNTRGYDHAMSLATVFVPFGMAIVGAVVALGPWVYTAVMRAWTAIVPERRSVSWFLARRAALSHLSYSAAVITPLFVATSAVGVIYEWIDVCRAVTRALGIGFHGTGLPFAQVVLFFGSAVIIAVVATAGVVFASARGKERDIALLTVSGATKGPVVRTAIFESVIYAVTTLLLALATLLLARVLYTAALSAGPVPGLALSAPPAAVYLICGMGLIFILVATLIPVQQSLRRDVMGALRTE